jgi:CRISPR-associated protein Cas2
MWIMVYFDLPVETPVQRRQATKFRKELMDDGFEMFQFSIYSRCCPSRENADVHMNRVKLLLPPDGFVAIMMFTDKQYGSMVLYQGRRKSHSAPPPKQLEMF